MPPNRTPARRAHHLGACTKIVARCLGLPDVSVAATRYMVAEAARQQAEGNVRPDVARLCLELEQATGRSIIELAAHARSWKALPRNAA